MLQERKVRHHGCVYSNLITFPFQLEVAHDCGLLCLLTCPFGLHGFPWAVAVFWNSMRPPFLQLDRAQAIYGQKSSLNLDHKYLLNKELFWGNPGGLSCKKKHGSWDLQWITEAKIPSYEILSQASVGGTLNVLNLLFLFLLRVDSFLVSVPLKNCKTLHIHTKTDA